MAFGQEAGLTRGRRRADDQAEIGRMRERVTLLSVARSKDSDGYATDGETEEQTVWAEADVQTGSEQVEQGGQRAQRVVRFRLRYRTDITARWRIRWEDSVYEVIEPPLNIDGRRRFIWLLCRQVEGE